MSDTVTFLINGKKLIAKQDPIKISVYIRNLIVNLAAEGESDDEDKKREANDSIEIPITNVDYITMEKILEWCEHFYNVHGKDSIEDPKTGNSKIWSEDILKEFRTKAFDKPLDSWDRQFLNVSVPELTSIIAASNFLNIQPLLDACCKVVAEHFRGKSPTEVIEAFATASKEAAK